MDPHPFRRDDFSLSDSQLALTEAFTHFLSRTCPRERVRASEPWGFDQALWDDLQKMRPVAMGLPEEAGGDGAGLVELCLVSEVWGYHLAPVPLIDAIVAARVVARTQVSAATTDWLQRALRDGAILSLVLHPAAEGSPQLVPAASVAGAFVALIGGELVLEEPTETPAHIANHGDTPIGWWNPTLSRSRMVLATGEAARALFEEGRREWQLLMAAALIGMGTGALEIAIEHAKTRRAFGTPIGGLQAISHPLVNVSMGIDAGRRLVHKAAWYADNEPDRDRHRIPMAYLHAERTATFATTLGVHVLGGVGFTVECDEQLYFRRVKGWSAVAGGTPYESSALEHSLFGGLEHSGSSFDRYQGSHHGLLTN
jgi:alkylation response protein AidB-like acyl-CoA dehydrogenase